MPFEDVLFLQGAAGTPSYSAREFRQLVSALFWNEGILTGHAVSQRGAGANMTVDIASGRAAIQGDDQASPPQGMYITNNTGTDNVAIGAAPGSNSRIDVVYMRINDPNATGPAGNNATYGVVAGTVAASPVAPSVPTSAIPVAQVLVTAGTASITDAMITDRRRVARLRGRPPVGCVFDFPGIEANVPADHLVANGQAVLRKTYFELFFQYGTTYGSGDGSTTFNVPDYRGRVGVGLDNMGGSDAGVLSVANTLGATGGEQNHQLTTAELANHNHTQNAHNHTVDPGNTAVSISDPGHNHTTQARQSAGINVTSGSFATVAAFVADTTGTSGTGITASVDIPSFASANTTAVNQATGGDAAHNNMQPYILTNKIILAL